MTKAKRQTICRPSLTSSFDPDKEVKRDLRGRSWLVLRSLMEAEQKALVAEQRQEERCREREKKEDKLENREKW